MHMNLSQVKKNLDSNDLGFICAGVSNVGGYKRNARYELSVTNLLSHEHQEKTVSWQFSEMYDVWCNQSWQWLEEECHRPVLQVWWWQRLCLHLQRMDRKWSAVGAASVQHPCHTPGCCQPSGRTGPQVAAASGQRDWHLPGASRTVLSVLWWVFPFHLVARPCHILLLDFWGIVRCLYAHV